MVNLIRKAYLIKNFILSSIRFRKLIQRPSEKKSDAILVVKPEAIGDYVLFRNLLRDLRKGRKEKIILLGNELWKNIAEKFDRKYVNRFIFLNRGKFFQNDEYRQNLLNEINDIGIKEVIYPTFSRQFEVDYFISKINAEKKTAFYGDYSNMLKLQKNISDKYYSQLIDVPAIHEFDRNKKFFEKILREELRTEMTLPVKKVKSKPYAIIFPGASSKTKIWPMKNFLRISRFLLKRFNLDILACGSKEEIEIVTRIKKKFPEVKNMAGKTDLLELIDLIGNADILVTNDTSAVHIAAATKTKTVCPETGIFYGRFLPYPKRYSHIKCVDPPFYFRDFHGPIFLIKPESVEKEIVNLLK